MNENAINLLRGNLKAMYFQTKQWIEDIEFYEEELTFFNSLISDRIATTTTEDLEHKTIFRNIDTLFYKLSEDLINQIKNHRKELSQLIEADKLLGHHAENIDHFYLLERMSIIKHAIKKLKKALFRYLQDHPFEFDFDAVLKEL